MSDTGSSLLHDTQQMDKNNRDRIGTVPDFIFQILYVQNLP
jgi:hypothetical protein